MSFPLEDKRRRYLTLRQIAARLGKPETYPTIRRNTIKAFLARAFGDIILNLATGRNYHLLVDEDHYLEVIQFKGRP